MDREATLPRKRRQTEPEIRDVPHPAHIARMSRPLGHRWERLPLESGWSLHTARPTERVALAIAQAFEGEIERVGDEYEVVMNFGRAGDGGAPLEEASFMIVQSDRIIGVCLVQLFTGGPEISYLCTEHSVRRRGAAKALLNSSLGALTEAGHTHVALFVTRTNGAAVGLYEQFGFIEDA